eukprot:TRINITY_DN13985_c0_g6_i1.p1 TRINITY_DN13985_c0_g6~~TRINITY_DN13985_c0_g6_i1.p1  ORF type:complete len:871 (+),score=147.82 TRINITY_DN13985_c0_g6_i1:531-3143(+)
MDGQHRVAQIFLDLPKKGLDPKEMGFSLRELAKFNELCDEVHMHARIIIKPEVLRYKNEAEVKRIIQEEEGRALALLEICYKKYGPKKAGGTTVKYDATLCDEAKLEDYIIGVMESKRVVIDVLVLGFKVEDSKKTGILSSLHAAPGAMIGPGGNGETMMERISRQMQCSVYYLDKDGRKLKRVVYDGPRREIPLDGEIVDPRGTSSDGSFRSTPPQRRTGLQASLSLPVAGPTSPPISGHFQPASYSVSPAGHFPASGAFHPVPGGYYSGPQYSLPVPRSPGHTGPISLSPGYRYVMVPDGASPGHGDASAPPLYPVQSSPPHFVSGNSSTGPHYGSPDPGYGHSHPGGATQPHVYGSEYFVGHAGESVYPPGFAAAQGSGYSAVQPNGVPLRPGEGVYMPGFMVPRGSGSLSGRSVGQQPAASPARSAEPGRAGPSDVWRSNEQQPTQYQTVPAQPAGATQERVSTREQSYEGYSRQELTEATKDFSQELGGGGFGTVYLGTLRGTQVAVKKMNPEGLQGPEQFECEVKLLTTLRHRNIVILMGCCPEAFCLVYEYCAQGSLENRLADETRPLPWYTRVRIMLEIATAVLWMHKHGFVHCDIKLANMLLDESNTAKLGDVGISRMIPSPEARTARLTGALTDIRTSSGVRGSFGYVDPALFDGYPLKECSDVYALGVCLLQLLTRRPAGAVKREVKQAYVSKNMPGILDRSAGDWPLDTVVEDLANLGLRCTEYDQDNRPDLESEIIPVLSRLNDLGKAAERQELEGLRLAAAEKAARQAPGGRPRDNSDIMRNQFRCPLSLEVMEVPVMAADGHTYEKSFIERWLANSPTSPVTGLTLPNTNLIVNQAVKSAILEWKQRNGGQVGDD